MNKPSFRQTKTSLLFMLLFTVSCLGLLGATCKRRMKKVDEYHAELWTAEVDESIDRINHALIKKWREAQNKDAFEFPEVDPTPVKVPCGKRPHKPESSLWETGGWKELGFSMNQPFRYQYQIISSGKGPNAKFTIRAHGDLDCDGVWSTYELWGAIDGKGKVHNFDGKKFDQDKATE